MTTFDGHDFSVNLSIPSGYIIINVQGSYRVKDSDWPSSFRGIMAEIQYTLYIIYNIQQENDNSHILLTEIIFTLDAP